MVQKENKKLIIEIEHPCPEDFHRDLKEAIVDAIRYQSQDYGIPEHLHFVNYTLLELLKHLED